MAGEKDKLEGTVKKGLGKASGDQWTESQGKLQQLRGKAADVVDDASKAAKDLTKEIKDKTEK